MEHRISAGAIVVVGDRVLLVRHRKEDSYDFWVAPGGGVIGQEDILATAVREVKEETGLIVEAVKPVYLEQFHQPGLHHMKAWVLCAYISGEISTAAPEAIREYIVEARFFGEKEIRRLSKPLFPEVLRDRFWQDLQQDFPNFEYLGNREMEFY